MISSRQTRRSRPKAQERSNHQPCQLPERISEEVMQKETPSRYSVTASFGCETSIESVIRRCGLLLLCYRCEQVALRLAILDELESSAKLRIVCYVASLCC